MQVSESTSDVVADEVFPSTQTETAPLVSQSTEDATLLLREAADPDPDMPEHEEFSCDLFATQEEADKPIDQNDILDELFEL